LYNLKAAEKPGKQPLSRTFPCYLRLYPSLNSPESLEKNRRILSHQCTNPLNSIGCSTNSLVQVSKWCTE